MQFSIDRPAEFEAVASEAKTILYSQPDLPKPVVLNGHAMGLCATLAVCCDIVVAHTGVRIADPHVNVWPVAGDGALLWPQLIGYAKAKRYLLKGDLLKATDAERLGLPSEVGEPEQLDGASLAERLARGATKAIRWTKITANLPLRQLMHRQFYAGVAYEIVSNISADHA